MHLADADYINTYIISPLGTAYSIESFPLKSAHVDTSSRYFEADDASVNFILNLMIRHHIHKRSYDKFKPCFSNLINLLNVL